MSDWKHVRLGDICIIERGASPRPIDKYITASKDGVNWIKIGDTDDSMYITSTAQKITVEGAKKSRYVQVGDFILSNSMSFGRPYILRIDGCIHDGWLLLRDTANVFDKKFLYYYLSSPSTYFKFKMLAVGGVVNNLNSQMVRELNVLVPPREEQHKIVKTLDKVMDLIEKRKKQIEKLDELIKSRFIEMFGDSVSEQVNWKILPWTLIVDIKNGKNQRAVECVNGEFPIYGSGGIMGYANHYICNENSVVIGRKGNINKPILVRTKFWNIDTAFGLEPKQQITVEYLYYFCVFYDFEKLNKTVTIPSLSLIHI